MPHLSEYTLTDLLHRGPRASLHRGVRSADRAPVLIKLLDGEYPSPREVARLRHEYLICRDLDAPGVLRAHGLEKTGHGLALILEDFGGRTLASVLRSGRLEQRAALQIAASLAEAVGAVHDRHVIHKDINPHNILVDTRTGAVKLTEFGSATRLSQETHKETSPDALEGTLPYMSPEQTGRMNRVLDYRTDLYSLGVTLYEMLTGVLPFTATEPMELVHSHIARTPPSPHHHAPEVPEVVSAIVMKLLAKAAEDRYQSAYGLKADLDACLAGWGATGPRDRFTLGTKDVPGDLRIVQKLYGRAAETATLLAAFERVSAGGAELLLISGYAGVGKSALVSEVHQALARRGGRFCAGKFDQLSRNVPYTAVAAALRELCRHLLAEPKEVLDRWKSSILAAVGSNGRLLVDLVPELALVIGPQPPVPELGPSESQNRFNLVFQNFLRVFTTAEHALVLFLDDLQWADPASLKLLSLLLSDPDRGHLLIIGAYRDHEVTPDHLLYLSLDELRKDGAQVREIALAPLGLPDVEGLIADTLGCERDKVLPFARILFDKTHGNPFFLCQLLRSLHAEGLIAFDQRAGAWGWDLERVEALEVTDNVVDFMAGKIARLPPEARRVLSLAACIGHQFNLKMLALISEMSPRAAAAALWHALREGLVLPLDPEYRFVAEPGSEREDDPALEQVFDVGYRFLHDRVQQAAYSSIEERHRQELHLRIGRLLRDQSDEKEREERLFSIVDHLNLGAGLMVDRRERLDLAQANLTAGKRAKAATAYEAALRYLDAAAGLVDEACWGDAYPLCFALHLERAECAYLNGHFEAAESLFGVLLSHAESRLDRAQVYKLCILLATARSDFAGAIRHGRAALAMFGIDIPETEEAQRAALDVEFAALEANLKSRRIEELVDAPPLVDLEHRIPLEILVQVSPASFFSSVTLGSLVSTLQTNLCLKHGRSDLAAFSYAYASVTQVTALGHFKEGREFFRVGVALDEQYDTIALQGRTNVVLVTPAHFFISFRAVLHYVARGQRAALTSGDFLFLSFTCYHDVMPRLCAGDELGSVREALGKNFALAHRTKSELVIATLIIARQMIAALEGSTRGRTSLSDDGYDEAAHLSEMEGNPGFGFALSWFHAVKLELYYLYGDHARALAAAAQAKATAGGTSVFHFWTDVPFYAGLALAAIHTTASAEDRERYAAQLAEEQAQIATWAESCPANYRHKELLLAAEAARIAGRESEAMDLYDQAIGAAEEGGFSHHQGLGSELAAKFHLDRGREKVARAYLADACAAYRAWGATAKVAELAERYPRLIAPAQAEARGAPGAVAVPIDLLTVIKASQAISGEIDLHRLLDRLMTIVIENAGADRGYLVRRRGEDLVIEAEARVEQREVKVLQSGAAPALSVLPGSILNYVERTRQNVILDDAGSDARFSSDEALAARRPRSVLCIPLVRQAEMVGLLYLENSLTVGAFTKERLSVLEVLSSQAAISLENAVLYAELSRENAERRRAEQEVRELNSELERRVEERTAQLAEANRELEAFSYSVSHDLRSPLRTIDGFSLALLEDHGDKLDGDARDALGRVRKASLRMHELIEDLLALSRVTRGEMTREEVDLSALAREVAAEIHKASPDREVTWEIAPGVTANGDARMLKIVLENLLGNAFKFTGKHPRARIELGVREQPDGRRAYFVRDDGAGFNMKYTNKLFGAFQRLHKADEFEGTGIGLATVRRIVGRHGGQIWAEGAVEKGAMFYFTLP